MQQLPGIGPFYSALIVVRACGLTDVLPDEPHVANGRRLYGRSMTDGEFAELAEAGDPSEPGWRCCCGCPQTLGQTWPVPEGDTVWRSCRRLHAILAGQVLTRTEFRVPTLATTDLAGVTVLEVVPRGKHQLFRFDNDYTLHTHFRMDGTWRTFPRGRALDRW